MNWLIICFNLIICTRDTCPTPPHENQAMPHHIKIYKTCELYWNVFLNQYTFINLSITIHAFFWISCFLPWPGPRWKMLAPPLTSLICTCFKLSLLFLLHSWHSVQIGVCTAQKIPVQMRTSATVAVIATMQIGFSSDFPAFPDFSSKLLILVLVSPRPWTYPT